MLYLFFFFLLARTKTFHLSFKFHILKRKKEEKVVTTHLVVQAGAQSLPCPCQAMLTMLQVLLVSPLKTPWFIPLTSTPLLSFTLLSCQPGTTLLNDRSLWWCLIATLKIILIKSKDDHNIPLVRRFYLVQWIPQVLTWQRRLFSIHTSLLFLLLSSSQSSASQRSFFPLLDLIPSPPSDKILLCTYPI